MKKLYYTVEFECDENDYRTGHKTITVYEITKNKPTQLTSIDCPNESVSPEKIQEYLNDNGMGDDKYTFICL